MRSIKESDWVDSSNEGPTRSEYPIKQTLKASHNAASSNHSISFQFPLFKSIHVMPGYYLEFIGGRAPLPAVSLPTVGDALRLVIIIISSHVKSPIYFISPGHHPRFETNNSIWNECYVDENF